MCIDNTDCGCGCNEVVSKRGLPGERGPAGPQGPPGGGTILSDNVVAAINASNSPSGSNPFATINDLATPIGGIISVPQINISETPIVVGEPIIIPTTLLAGSIIYSVTVNAEGLDGSFLQIGLEGVQEDFLTVPLTNDVRSTYAGESLRSNIPNINIVLNAIDNDITTGTLRLIINTL